MFSCNLAKLHQKKLTKKYTKKGFQEKVFEHEGSKINYQEGGEGETVMLIHGFGGDGKITWESAARFLVKDYHVVVPDLIWFGKSVSTEEPSLQLQVDVLSALIDTLNVKQLTLVGISYGGFVSLGISLKKKELVKQTIIVDSPGMTYNLQLLDSLCVQNDVESVDEIFVPNNGEEVQRLFDIAFYKDKKIPGFIRPAVYEMYFSQHHAQLTKLLASLPAEKEKFEQHTRTDFPEQVSLIWGEYDEVFPLSEGEKLAKYFGTNVQVISKAGHAPNIEQTKIFNQELINLLKAAK
jgi:pimeloyl-ACP methyl ester carboxylesterase